MRVLIVLIVLLLAGSVHSAPVTGTESVQDLAWLAGCWASRGGEPGSGEQWSVPAGGTLFGINRTVRDSRTVAFETMQIVETGEGRIEFVANPSGQAGARFALVQIGDQEVVFENREHDFPQRILYRLTADGNMEARIEGEQEGRTQAIDFPMDAVACDPAPDRKAEADALLALHEGVLAAHRNGDLETWMTLEGDGYVSANNGTMTFPSAAERRAGREPYLAATIFTVYRDLKPPVVRVSDDGTLGWVIAEVEVNGMNVTEGVETKVEVVWAWIELYEKQSGTWKMVGNVSNRQP